MASYLSIKRWSVPLMLLTCLWPLLAMSQTCHYKTWAWNKKLNKAVAFTSVQKSYENLQPDEIDHFSGCTVCLEDQQRIALPNMEPFYICKVYAQQLEQTLLSLLHVGQPLSTITGYRVGKTRGDLDVNGNRTVFSNHSFGTAIDINAEHNGLYTNCFQFGAQCRLLRGGHWQPGMHPDSLTRDSLIVTRLREIGFKWGGEIEGRQKDFMHFSLTGY